MERFIATQTKINESLGESINLLTSRLDALAVHQKTMDAQITQIAQQVSHLSRPQGDLPSQPETNPRGYINAISSIEEGLEESLVMVLQEVVTVPHSRENGERREKNTRTLLERLAIHP